MKCAVCNVQKALCILHCALCRVYCFACSKPYQSPYVESLVPREGQSVVQETETLGYKLSKLADIYGNLYTWVLKFQNNLLFDPVDDISGLKYNGLPKG